MTSGEPSPDYLPAWAEVSWQTPATPRSMAHGDIYWSPDQGPAEKQHVFIEGNQLRRRWQRLARGHFTLAEIGFGFGLNCLLTANVWRQQRPVHSMLNYIAFEKSPLRPADLQSLYSRLGALPGIDGKILQRHAGILLERHPLPTPGHHLIWLDDDICLDLVIGDVNDTLHDTDARVDAWYLDGFSPSSNPDAWDSTLLRRMADMGRPGSTLATYSVAGEVRKSASEAGFRIERRPGFGNKAEMLTAALPGAWRRAELPAGEVAIVGAGIAGLNCARALGRRGIDTTIFDSGNTVPGGASSIPRLAMSPQLAARPSRRSLLSLSAFHYATQVPEEVHRTGGCRLAANENEEARFMRIADHFPDTFCRYLDAPRIADVAGVDAGLPGLWFPTAAWCRAAQQFRETARTVNTGVNVECIEPGRLTLADGKVREFDAVILATGARPTPWTMPLQLVPVRGQSISASLAGNPLKTMISGPVSLIPDTAGSFTGGATFDRYDADSSLRDDDTQMLAEKVSRFLGARIIVHGAHAGVRCSTRDRTPVTGRVPDWHRLADYCERKMPVKDAFEDYEDGLFVCTGFGSHGATMTPLAAEYLVRLFTGEATGIGRDWARSLDAARFKLRDRGRPAAGS